MKKIAECGTRSGYNRHKKKKETPCQPCIEANSADSLAYRNRNLDKTREYQRKFYEKNKAKVLEKHKEYYYANKDVVLKRHKKYYRLNPDIYRRAKHRRRAKERLNGFEKYTTDQVLESYGINCHICKEEIDMSAPRGVGIPGWEKGLHIDHVIPISKGGSDTLGNVRPAHGICNLSKNTKVIEEVIC